MRTSLSYTSSIICVAFSLLAMLFGIGSPPALAQGYGAKYWMQEGTYYENANNFKSAIESYSKVIEVKPSWNAYLARARCYYQLNKEHEAILDCTRALDKRPNQYDCLRLRGLCNIGLKQYESALDDFTKSAEAKPKYFAGYNNKGIAYEFLGQYDKALAEYTTSISLARRDYRGYMNRARLNRERLKDLPAALADNHQAVLLAKQIDEPYLDRAKTYIAFKDYNAALTDCDKAIGLSPEKPTYLIVRGKIYGLMGKASRGVEDFGSALRLNGSLAEAYLARAEAHETLHQYKEAASDYKKAIECGAKDLNTYERLAELQFRQSNFESCTETLNKAITDFPKTVSLYRLRGASLFALHQYDKAGIDLDEAVRHDPNDAISLQMCGQAFVRTGQYERAIAMLQQALALDSRLNTCYADLAVAFAKLGRVEQGQHAIEMALKAKPAKLQNETLQAVCFISSENYCRAQCAFANILLGNQDVALTELDSLLQRCDEAQVRALACAYRAVILAERGRSKDADGDFAKALATANNDSYIKALAPRIAPPDMVPSTSESSALVEGVANLPVRDKWAIVVGIGKFAHSQVPVLRYADKDAKDFYDFLIKEANFPRDHVRLLLNEKATQRRLLSELGTKFLARVAKPDDLVVLFLSTHGSPSDADVKGNNFVVAYDTDPGDLFATGIEMQRIAELIKRRIDSKRVLVVMDACYSGATDTNAKAMFGQRNIDADAIVQGTGQLVICSSSPKQRSWESTRYANGIFTRQLLNALRSNGEQTKLGDALRATITAVSSEAKEDHGVEQTPILKSKWNGAELMLSVRPAASQAVPVAVSAELESDSTATQPTEVAKPAASKALMTNVGKSAKPAATAKSTK